MAKEGRCNSELMRRGVIQYHGGKQGKGNIGRGDIQVSGVAARPFGKNWPAVFRNIRKVCQFWERLVKLLQRKGEDQSVSEFFIGQWVNRFYSLGLITGFVGGNCQNNVEGPHRTTPEGDRQDKEK